MTSKKHCKLSVIMIVMLCLTTFISNLGLAFAETTEENQLRATGVAGGVLAEEPVFNVKWINGVSADTRDYSYDAGDTQRQHLKFHPIDNLEKTAAFNVSLLLKGSAQDSYPAGSIKIRVPSYIFKNWKDGKNVTLPYKDEQNTVALKWQIPMAPEKSGTSSFNYVQEGDYYVLTNFDAINGGKEFSFDMSFAFVPTFVKVDSNSNFDKTLGFNISIDKNLDGQDDFNQSKDLRLSLKTTVGPTDITLEPNKFADYNGIFFNWQPGWGEYPNDGTKESDYFYVIWMAKVQRSSNSSQPFDFVLEDNSKEGELIGVRRINTQLSSNNTPGFGAVLNATNVDHSYTNIAKPGYKDLLDNVGINKEHVKSPLTYVGEWSIANANKEYFMLLKRYPKSLLKEAKAKGIDLKADGLPINNSVKLKETLGSGAKRELVADASQKIHQIDYQGTARIYKNQFAMLIRETEISNGQTWLKDGNVITKLIEVPWYHYSYSTLASSYSPGSITWNDEKNKAEIETYNVELQEGNHYFTPKLSQYELRTKTIGGVKDKLIPAVEGDLYFHSVIVSYNNYDAKYSEFGGWQKNATPSKDFERYKPVKVLVKQEGQSNFTEYGQITVENNGDLTFTSTDKSITVDKVGTSTGGVIKNIILPPKTIDLKFSYDSDFYNTELKSHYTLSVNPTENVLNIVNRDIEAGESTRIVSSANLTNSIASGKSKSINSEYETLKEVEIKLDSEKVSSRLNKNIEITYDGVNNSGNFIDDRNKGVQSHVVQLTSYNSQNYYNGMTPEEKIKVSEKLISKSGVFYDLLPYGTYIDSNEVTVGRADSRDIFRYRKPFPKSSYNVEEIKNWENSGRTMVKITYIYPDDFQFKESSYYSNIPKIYARYTLYNSYENIADNGTSALNSAAFIDTSELTKFRQVKDYTSIKEGKYFENLQTVNPGKMSFAELNLTYNPVSVLEAGVTKKVANETEKAYNEQSTAMFGDKYSYKLSYVTNSTTRSDNIVFYDILENGNGKLESKWKGTFDYIDLNNLENKSTKGNPAEKCKPVAYYATVIPTSDQLDVDNQDIWKPITEDIDKTTVKAIAIDCRKTDQGNGFIMDRSMSMNAFIHMKAPAKYDKALLDKYSVNEVSLQIRSFEGEEAPAGATSKIIHSTAKVKLVDFPVTLEKTSNPETGTDKLPAEIQNKKASKLDYFLKVTNSSNRHVRNVVLVDKLPKLLSLKETDIKVTSKALGLDNATLKEANITLDMDKLNKGIFSFNISELKGNSDITFKLETKLTKEQVSTMDIVNTASITSVNDVDTKIDSKTLYHKVVKEYTLDYVVDGDDTYGYPADHRLPDSVTGISYDENKTLASKLTTSTDLANGKHGKWVFHGWKSSRDATDTITELKIRKNETVFGKWEFIPSKNINVKKVWDKENPDNDNVIKISLFKDGVDTGLFKELSKENNWTGVFEKLLIREGNNIFQYTVKEVGEKDNKLTIGEKEYTVAYDDGVITNTLVNPKISLEGKKVWVDNDNQDGIRPEHITLTLIKNGEKTDNTLEVNEESQWNFKFDNLDKYDDMGAEIEYIVSEEAVEGYETKIDGTTITNIHEPETVEVKVEKKWDDNNNKLNKRPAKIEIQLLADGEEVGEKTVINGEEDNWKYTFKDLPKYKEGKAIKYSISETSKIEDYESEITGTQDEGFVITNKLIVKPEPPTKDKPNNTPNTGVNDHLLVYIISILTSLLTLTIFRRKLIRNS